MNIGEKPIFHVHSYRCNHAENVSDEEYVKRSISIGATDIWFTDHAPFPGDPFQGRMRYDELDEYLSTLSHLKILYREKINVHIGLEIEYFPHFDEIGYYKTLKQDDRIELLLLGQHMAETKPMEYTFLWDKERLNNEEYIALGNSVIQGIESGYFDAVAHPDRIFRRQKVWSQGMEMMKQRIIHSAYTHNVPLEINESSKRSKHHYWNEFWNNTDDILIVHGLDAHSLAEIKLI